jgi:hypothetical protein
LREGRRSCVTFRGVRLWLVVDVLGQHTGPIFEGQLIKEAYLFLEDGTDM